MKATVRLQTFMCPHLHSTISRSACGERHKQYSGKGNYVRDGYNLATAAGVIACACRTCPIGELHAKGKLADVEVVQVEAQQSSFVKHVRRCTGCGEPLPLRVGKKSRVTPLCISCGGRGEVGFWEEEQFA